MIKKKHRIHIPGTCTSFAYDKLEKRILICDQNSTKVHVYKLNNVNLELEESVDLKKHLTWVSAIKISEENEIFLACEFNNGVYVFDNKLNLLKKLLITKESVDCMAVNENGSEIYLMSTKENKVIRYNGEDGKENYEYHIDSPWNISFRNKKLYVISGDSIIIFETNTNRMIHRISLVNWKDLSAIFVDEKSNLFVIAKDNDLSSNFLFRFNENNLLSKVKINDFENILDLIIIDDNLVILTQDDEVDFFLNIFEINTF